LPDAGVVLEGDIGEGNNVYNYQAAVREDLLSGSESFVFPREASRDDTQVVWLVEHWVDRSGPRPRLAVDTGVAGYGGSFLDLYWGKEGGVENTALAASLVYEVGGEFRTEMYTADPDAADGCGGGDFAGVTETGLFGVEDVIGRGDVNFRFRQRIDLPAVGVGDRYWVLRVRFLCNSDDQPEVLGVEAETGWFLPTQARCYDAVSSEQGIESSEGKEVTRLEQCLFYPSPPGIFDYTLFSGGGLTHQ
jgi:hypothetical protein